MVAVVKVIATVVLVLVVLLVLMLLLFPLHDHCLCSSDQRENKTSRTLFIVPLGLWIKRCAQIKMCTVKDVCCGSKEKIMRNDCQRNIISPTCVSIGKTGC